jgi:anti-anti-sigma factor
MNLKIEFSLAGAVVTLAGEFNGMAVAQVRPQIEQLLHESQSHVYVDLRDVTYIDAAAVGAFAFLFKRLAAQRKRLVLYGAIGQPRRLLELLHIDRIVELDVGVPDIFGHAIAGRAA